MTQMRLTSFLLLSVVFSILLLSTAEAGTLSGIVLPKIAPPASTKEAVRYPGLNTSSEAVTAQLSPAVIFLEGEGLDGDAEATAISELKQDGLEFQPRVLAVVARSSVRFPNLDSVYHNVFSYSSANRFDLGRYPQGEYRTESFDTPGVIRVYCEIHSHMRGYIVVVPNRFYAVTDSSGRFSIDDIPAGEYTAVIWQEGAKIQRHSVIIPEAGEVTLQSSNSAFQKRTAVAFQG